MTMVLRNWKLYQFVTDVRRKLLKDPHWFWKQLNMKKLESFDEILTETPGFDEAAKQIAQEMDLYVAGQGDAALAAVEYHLLYYPFPCEGFACWYVKRWTEGWLAPRLRWNAPDDPILALSMFLPYREAMQ